LYAAGPELLLALKEALPHYKYPINIQTIAGKA
jgi:hypothetical protein